MRGKTKGSACQAFWTKSGDPSRKHCKSWLIKVVNGSKTTIRLMRHLRRPHHLHRSRKQRDSHRQAATNDHPLPIASTRTMCFDMFSCVENSSKPLLPPQNTPPARTRCFDRSSGDGPLRSPSNTSLTCIARIDASSRVETPSKRLPRPTRFELSPSESTKQLLTQDWHRKQVAAKVRHHPLLVEGE